MSFPQILNVLNGEMSLVGTNARTTAFLRIVEESIPFFLSCGTQFDQNHRLGAGQYQYGASVEDRKRNWI